MDLIGGIAMESGILMIVIVVIGVFYPVYTAWISLVAAPVYLKIGFLFAMAGALLVMRILRKEKQIKWIVLIGILGAYAGVCIVGMTKSAITSMREACMEIRAML